MADEITRTKLYKSEKMWVAAVITIAGVGTIGILPSHNTHAASEPPATTEAPPTTGVTTGSTQILQSGGQDQAGAAETSKENNQPIVPKDDPTPNSETSTSSPISATTTEPGGEPLAANSGTNPTPKASTVTNTDGTDTNGGRNPDAETKDTLASTEQITANTNPDSQLPTGSPKSEPVNTQLVTAKDARGDYSVTPDKTGGTVALTPADAAHYFTATNRAGEQLEIRPDGSTTLTEGHTQMKLLGGYAQGTGYLLSNQRIDFTTDFTLSTTLTSTYTTDMRNNQAVHNPWLGGDGISLFFEALDPTTINSADAQSGEHLGLVTNTNKYPNAKDTISFNVSTNASHNLAGYTAKDDADKWYLFQAGADATKPTSAVTDTGIVLDDQDGSITYTLLMKYTAATRHLNTQVYKGAAAATADSNNQIATWDYAVPESASKTSTSFTLGASASIAESKATYTAQINYFTYHPATGHFAITATGLPEGDNRPDQSNIVGFVGDTVLFYPKGTTPATADKNGKAYVAQIAVPETDMGYSLKSAQEYTIVSGDNGVATLDYAKVTHGTLSTKRTIHYVTKDGITVAPDNVQTVTYATTTDGKSTIYTPRGIYTSVTSPQPDGVTLADANQATISQNLLAPSTAAPKDEEIKVLYKPSFTYGTMTSTRTIHYQTESGRTVAPDAVQTVNYKTVSIPDGTTVYTPTGLYASVTSPTGADLTLLDSQQEIVAQKVIVPGTTKPQAEEITVTYADPTYSYGTATATRTIHYRTEDGKTVAPDVMQTIDYKTTTDKAGKTIYTPQNVYEAVTSPNKPALTLKTANQAIIAREISSPGTNAPHDSEITVWYVNPSYSYGTATATRTIHYQTEDGKTVAPDVVQTINYKTVTDENGRTVYTAQNQISAVTSPTALTLADPKQATISAVSAGASTTTPSDSEVTVKYAAPDFAHGTVSSTRTINYQTEDGKTVAPSVTQTIIYKTTTDAAGHTVYTAQNVYEAVTSPTPAGLTLVDAGQATIARALVQPSTEAPTNTTERVIYAAPAFTHGTASTTRTIHYVDEAGHTLAPDLVQTIVYLSTTDPASGNTVYTPQNVYAASTSPAIAGYTTKQTETAMQNVGASDHLPANVELTITYTADPAPSADVPVVTNPDGSTPATTPTPDNQSVTEEPIATTLPNTAGDEPSTLPDTFGGADTAKDSSKPVKIATTDAKKTAGEQIQQQSAVAQHTTTSERTLPQTGDRQNHSLTLLGTIAFILSVFGLAIKRRSDAQ
ncbi:mucin-binding protein [Lacticaseibacillus zhaodongensis]|uniref:mucin-binding protein n=1 Tax=Lacticaseibacillus zhaodongensis TaxID=2668065 RepID=UPI0018B012A3|nr:LPXTG cell wall anchor domain-containing protein [Lacticaseibacillus zhaodongensis]